MLSYYFSLWKCSRKFGSNRNLHFLNKQLNYNNNCKKSQAISYFTLPTGIIDKIKRAFSMVQLYKNNNNKWQMTESCKRQNDQLI